jgi:hypothetical protein
MWDHRALVTPYLASVHREKTLKKPVVTVIYDFV